MSEGKGGGRVPDQVSCEYDGLAMSDPAVDFVEEFESKMTLFSPGL